MGSKAMGHSKLLECRAGPNIQLFMSDRSGVTAIEYGLISSLIAAALVVGLATAGPTLAGIFEQVSAATQNTLTNT
jgi:Flp pilus assembly pilin Flp